MKVPHLLCKPLALAFNALKEWEAFTLKWNYTLMYNRVMRISMGYLKSRDIFKHNKIICAKTVHYLQFGIVVFSLPINFHLTGSQIIYHSCSSTHNPLDSCSFWIQMNLGISVLRDLFQTFLVIVTISHIAWRRWCRFPLGKGHDVPHVRSSNSGPLFIGLWLFSVFPFSTSST